MHRQELSTVVPYVVALGSLGLLLALLAGAPAAHAHATLLKSEPASQAVQQAAPEQVVLTFSERVSLKLGGVEVFAPSGARVGRPATANGSQVSAAVHAENRGTYAVSWRVISADGHPIRGAFTFSVGKQSSSSAAKRVFAEAETDRPLGIAFGTVRFLYILGILVAVGGVMFAAVIAPSRPLRLVAPALAVVIAASVVGFFLQAAIASNVGVLDTLDGDVVSAQLSTLYGNAAVLRIVLAALCLAALRLAGPLRWGDRPTRVMVAGVFVALALSQSVAGHAMATTPVALRLPLDMLHVLFAAVWFGGLVQLYRYARSEDASGTAIARYSRLALVSVAVLVSTGTYAALAESDLSLDALGTAYGRILLAKIVLFVLILPIANLNRTRHVPGIVAAVPESALMLQRFVRFELATLFVVLGLTAWLIETTPTRHALHKASAPSGPVNEVQKLPSGARLRLTIEPGRVGPNAIAVRVSTAAGAPDAAVDEVRLTGTLKQRKINQLPVKVRRRRAGVWTVAREALPLAGRWRFDVAVRRGEFDEETTRVDVDVASPAGQP